MGRFSSDTDYAATFTGLYHQNESAMQAAAARVDAKREGELAAKDSLVFTKWQEGKISGGQLMAHIRARQNATSYDRAQQLKWREAAVTYGDVIADEKAEAAYAENQNINALVAHYAGRLASARKGTPERRELAQRLRTLRDQRDAENIRKKARKIARAVERGDMNTQDLIDFYKAELPGLRGDLRESVLDTLTGLRAKRRSENFEVAMQKIDNELGTGHLSPQDAATKKMDVLKKFNIEHLDKVGYQKWLQQVQQLRAMPDPAEVEKLDFDLAAENITPQQYIASINEWADRIAPYDITAAWELRTEAQKFLESEYTPLADPGALGFGEDGLTPSEELGGGSRGFSGTVEVVKNLRGNAIKFITQFDGSKYSGTNCAMASGAMLAHMMGYPGLTGADVRANSGDTEGGTNVFQVASALSRSGVPGKELDARSNIAWEEFKKKVSNGAPAVLSGWTGDIPSQFNSTSGIMGHSVAVAGFDEKRDAFLVLDPSGKKMWWPASVVQDFGWGGKFNGIAMFAPQRTLDPKTLDRVSGKIKHISVNAKPTRPGSPEMSQFDPGPQANGELQAVAMKELRKQRERLRDGGVDNKQRKALTSQQAVEKLIDDRADDIAELQGVIDRALEQIEAGGGEFDGTLEMVGTGDVLTGKDFEAIQKQLIYLYDAQEVLYRGIGNKAKARLEREKRRGVLVGAAYINSLENEYATNVQTQDIQSTIRDLKDASGPDEFLAAVEEVREAVDVITTLNEKDEDEEEEGIVDAVQTEADADADSVGDVTVPELDENLSEWDQLDEILNGDYEDAEELIEAVAEWSNGSEMGQTDEGSALIEVLATTYAEETMLLSKTGSMVMLPTEDGGHELKVVANKEGERWNPETEQMEPVVVPDIAGYLGPDYVEGIRGMGFDVGTLPQARISTVDGVVRIPAVPSVAPYPGVEFLVWSGTVTEAEEKALLELGIKAHVDGVDTVKAGKPLTEEQINQITQDPTLLEGMKRRGTLTVSDFPVMTVDFGDRTFYLDKLSTPDGTQLMWHEDALPYIGRVVPDDGLDRIGAGYFGATVQENGELWIDYSGDIDMDPTTTGSTFIDAGVTAMQAREDTIEKGGIPEVIYGRDPDVPGEAEVITQEDGRHELSFKTRSLQEYLAERQATLNKVTDKLASVLPPEQAAELAFLSKPALQELANDYNVNWSDGEWGPDRKAETPDVGILDEMGINQAGTPQEDETPQPTFDHNKAAREGGMGVAARNAEDRAAEVASAAAAAKEAESALSIPKVTPSPKPSLRPKDTNPFKTPDPSAPPKFKDFKPKPPTPTPEREISNPRQGGLF